MATFNEIKEIRLRIDDPAGYIDIKEVATLPTAPTAQTAYRLTTDGNYYGTDAEAPVTADWSVLELVVSDSRLGVWFDVDGTIYAVCYGLKQIIAKLGKDLRLKRSDSGAESTEWTALKETYEYYKSLLASCTDDYNKSKAVAGGRWGGSLAPEISGDNL